ncbi:hypothetical protein EG68_08141 [Paragonimus skrjabini miyazakii]|uniref:BPTI/Kunitz inhibitor domain-containing protein n=1 Tax=Paragonimus skrjabini miyazakii TaxID=59628 RepID=A0A8S9YJ45_9TREM|nr:hypothetical protein EG68_08140 [Paragonimus skrjabini miyazakii]KAF7253128.1 hypothetical protein EG68_08141 [Paragonimus skrjabini miyazakii]
MNCRVLIVVSFVALLCSALGEQNEAVEDPCLLPIDEGVCRALIKQFAYDWEIDDCVQFYYGGCGGNENRFDTKEECEKRCITSERVVYFD